MLLWYSAVDMQTSMKTIALLELPEDEHLPINSEERGTPGELGPNFLYHVPTTHSCRFDIPRRLEKFAGDDNTNFFRQERARRIEVTSPGGYGTITSFICAFEKRPRPSRGLKKCVVIHPSRPNAYYDFYDSRPSLGLNFFHIISVCFLQFSRPFRAFLVF
jgi:hypothetical protein